MATGFSLIAGICGAILWFTETTPPPKYEKLVAAILSGEVDESAQARKLLETVQNLNPTSADQYELVIEAFELRRQINLEARVSDIVHSRLLIRALSNPIDTAWKEHPLRNHALAEAYSLLAQGVAQNRNRTLTSGLGVLEPNELFSRAYDLYATVRNGTDLRRITPQLRYSASNNIANIALYQGDYEKALSSYLSTIRDFPESKSPGILGNTIVAYIFLGDYEKAIQFGEDARIWAEENGKALQDTTHYVSILTNTGFGYLANGQFDQSAELFEFSALVVDDNDTRLNIALSYSMGGNAKDAEASLRKVSEPISYNFTKKSTSMSAEKRCSYLIWALHDADADPRNIAASFYIFLGEHRAVSELEKYSNPEKLAALRERVAGYLPKFPGSCANLSAIPSITLFVANGHI